MSLTSILVNGKRGVVGQSTKIYRENQNVHFSCSVFCHHASKNRRSCAQCEKVGRTHNNSQLATISREQQAKQQRVCATVILQTDTNATRGELEGSRTHLPNKTCRKQNHFTWQAEQQCTTDLQALRDAGTSIDCSRYQLSAASSRKGSPRESPAVGRGRKTWWYSVQDNSYCWLPLYLLNHSREGCKPNRTLMRN